MNNLHNLHFNKEKIIILAEKALLLNPLHITDVIAPLSPGSKHEFYSNGDYWWPNPNTPSGLPYVRRDGESNPGNFNTHRMILREMRTAVARLAAAYHITREEKYAEHAVRMLREFFLDEETKMLPHLKYAQAIPGVCDGRGIGIIDTLHLTEVPFAIGALESSPAMTEEILAGLKRWFSDYLDFMNEHPNGIEERDTTNNHATCWHVQALSFAGFVGNKRIISECVERYKNIILPGQMRSDGGFPSELGRTKPYAYSQFVLDNTVLLVHLATLYSGEDIWSYETPDGRSIKRGLEFLLPYLTNKSKWFLPPDIEHFEGWPARSAFMLLAAERYKDDENLVKYRDLYFSLTEEITDEEVLRSIPIREPILLFIQS